MPSWSSFHGVGVHDLAYSIQRLQAAIGAAMSGDWATFSMNMVGLVGKLVWSFKDKLPGFKETKDFASKNNKPPVTFIIDVTIMTVAATDMFNGFSSPTDGSDFTSGAKSFENASQYLSEAAPAAYWRGEAANAYAAMNAELQSLASRAQSLDGQMANLVTAQQADVKTMHNTVSILLMGCVAAQGVAIAIALSGPPTPAGRAAALAASYKFQLTFAATTLSALVAEEIRTAEKANDKADQAKQISDSYAEVGKVAQKIVDILNFRPSDASSTPDGSGARKRLESAVSGFEAGSGDMTFANEAVQTIEPEQSGMSAVRNTASLAGLRSEGTSGSQRSVVSALTGDGPALGAGLALTSEAMEDPAFKLTTAHLTQFTELLGQTAKPSGGVSELRQTTGRAPQFAAGAQQDQGIAAVPKAAGAGGASAAGEGERAPIDAPAVGPHQAQEPSPVEQIGLSR